MRLSRRPRANPSGEMSILDHVGELRNRLVKSCAALVVATLVAFSLLIIIVLLLPGIIASTVSQLVVGVSFTTGEIVGPIMGFLFLGLVASWIVVLFLRPLAASSGHLFSVLFENGSFQRTKPTVLKQPPV